MNLNRTIDSLVDPFAAFPKLMERLQFVLQNLPEEILLDFLSDPHFLISLDDFTPGKGRTVLVPSLNPVGNESRCVVLKERLNSCQESFAHYIIAHEFAHAYLRNGGWGEITDREDAADALAASWGFQRPRMKFWES